MEKNLSKEYREVMEEAKAMCLTSCMSASVSSMDAEDLVTNVKALRLVNRLIDLCGDLFEKQEKLMNKMDKVMDKYLEK